MKRMADEEATQVDKGVTCTGWRSPETMGGKLREDWLRARAREARLEAALRRVLLAVPTASGSEEEHNAKVAARDVLFKEGE